MLRKKINNLTKSGGSLSQRVVRGGFWVFASQIVNRSFNFVRLIILARILAPHDFGLMGIALLTMSTLDTFSQTGFQASLIQKKEDIKPYLDSAWTVMILRGLVLFTTLYFIAPYAATFFNALEARPIIRVIGFAILFQAFTNIGVIYFQKELEFNKQFVYQFVGTLSDFIVAISAVLILRNVWALVFGLLAGNFARFIVSYIIHPYRPHLSFDFDKARELFGFGKWVLGSSILIFLLTQGDDAFVGKFLGATMLGFYQLAYRISNMPATEITHVISQVTFPAYSKLQDDIPKLREAYLKVLQFTAFLSFPIAGMIFVLAPDFTKIFLGTKWMPAVPAMQVLAIFGITRSINATFGPVFQGIGRPSILTKASAIQLIIMIILIYPFTTKWGILGTSLAVIVPNFLVCIYLSKKLINAMDSKFTSYLKYVCIPTIGTGIMIFLLASIQFLGEENLSIFLSSIVSGIALYIGLLVLISKFFAYNLIDNIKQLLNDVR